MVFVPDLLGSVQSLEKTALEQLALRLPEREQLVQFGVLLLAVRRETCTAEHVHETRLEGPLENVDPLTAAVVDDIVRQIDEVQFVRELAFQKICNQSASF